MSIYIDWYIPDKVIINKAWGEVSNDRYREAAHLLYEMVASADQQPIHVISDTRELTRLPGIRAMSDIKRHAQMGWLIQVGLQDKILEFLSSVAFQAAGFQIKFVPTLYEASALLRRVDPDLAEMPLIDEAHFDSHSLEGGGLLGQP